MLLSSMAAVQMQAAVKWRSCRKELSVNCQKAAVHDQKKGQLRIQIERR